jgi:hypothetical protein
MVINKPLPPVLNNKHSNEIIKTYYRFLREANGLPIISAWYVAKIEDTPPLPVYDFVRVPLILNDVKFCLEALDKATKDSQFIRWR